MEVKLNLLMNCMNAASKVLILILFFFFPHIYLMSCSIVTPALTRLHRRSSALWSASRSTRSTLVCISARRWKTALARRVHSWKGTGVWLIFTWAWTLNLIWTWFVCLIYFSLTWYAIYKFIYLRILLVETKLKIITIICSCKCAATGPRRSVALMLGLIVFVN